jgi:N-sulfoglucosamine sulfohydrolase
MNLREFTKLIVIGVIALPLLGGASDVRPNILIAIADDWGAHAGAYGDDVVQTPMFDRIAKEGILFEHAYISSPSCAPSRAAILTGQWHWRLETAANLFGPIPAKFPLYPDLLEAAGYFVGYTRKGWGPGKDKDRARNPAGNKFKDFATFLAERPKDRPFCFWFGSQDPHRSYVKDSGAKSGIPLDRIDVPDCFPDVAEIRGDVADYYFEVQRFDREAGEHIEQVRALGELDNTIVVMTSDHGMPFPRCKSNIYDDGAHVPLAIHWPGHYEGGHRVEDFVSSTDFAPTFLDSAGVSVPDIMTGRSLVPLLRAGKGGRIDPSRSHVLFGKERHIAAQAAPDTGGYPCRAIRTGSFLLIRNFCPARWPAGTEDYITAKIPGAWFADCDNSPTKTYMVENRGTDAEHQRLFDLAFAKRPEYELFDLRKDPIQQKNEAANPEYAEVLAKLAQQLEEELRASGDPRVVGGGEAFDSYPHSGMAQKHPSAKKVKKRKQKK